MVLPQEAVDAVVIGCGVQGSSAAYHLATMCGLRVAIVDRFAQGGVASRASAAMVTQQTGIAVTTALAKESVALYRDYVSAGWDIDFTTCGYTTFASDQSSQHVEATARALEAAGVDFEMASDLAAAAMVRRAAGEFMTVAQDAHASVYVPSDGYVDPGKLVSAFIARGGRRIVRVDSPVEAVRVLTSASGVIGVRLSSGETISCSVAVNCAGAWAAAIGRQVGLDLPIRRSRRQMAVVRTEPTWQPSGIVEHLSHSDGEWYFRPAADGVLVGTGSVTWLADDVPLVEDPAPEPELHSLIGHYLERNTIAEEFQVLRAWAGDRPITHQVEPDNAGDALASGGTNVEVRDSYPMVGMHPTVEGYVDSCGWGEFGVTLAPIGGKLVAGIVSTGALPDAPANLSDLRSARFTAGFSE